jgi:hypothetical protein
MLYFAGILYMVPCVSGAIGDTVLSRFTCTLVSLVLFLIGKCYGRLYPQKRDVAKRGGRGRN